MARGSGGHSSGGGFDFAPEFHIGPAAGSVVFAILYAIALLYYLRRANDNTTYVFIMLSFFCAIRVTSFALKAVIEGIDTTMQGIQIAAEVFYGSGFFALLDSAYTLVLDREVASGNIVNNPISRVTSNRYLVYFALCIAVATGIAEAVSLFDLREGFFAFLVTSEVIFFAVVVLLGVHTAFQVYGEHAALKRGTSDGESPRTTYVTYIPCLVVVFLLVREVYLIVRTTTIIPQSKVVWHLFAAVPELLAVFCFAVPSLVPQKGGPIPHAHWNEDPEVTKSV